MNEPLCRKKAIKKKGSINNRGDSSVKRRVLTRLKNSISYRPAQITGRKMRHLLRGVGKRPRPGRFRSFCTRVEVAMTCFITEEANSRKMIRPHQLVAQLRKIECAADHLSSLLSDFRHAQDAMVRASPSSTLVSDPLSIFPYAPPVFASKAIEIADAARAAAGNFEAAPYVRSGRKRNAMNELIIALISAWNESYAVPATFTGAPSVSPFVKFVGACLSELGVVPQSNVALAKTCSRLAASTRR